MKEHNFENIVTSDDVLNIQNTIGKGFGSREREFLLGVNDYFGHIITNWIHARPKYWPGQ